MEHFRVKNSGIDRGGLNKGQCPRLILSACPLRASIGGLRMTRRNGTLRRVRGCGRRPFQRLRQRQGRGPDSLGGLQRRDIRLPGTQRGRQDHRPEDANDPAPADGRERPRGRVRHRQGAERRAAPYRRRATGGRPRRQADRARVAPAPGTSLRPSRRGRQETRRGDGGAGRHRRRHGPPDRHVLRRHEAEARPGRRSHPQPPDPLPRRADHRARSHQPSQGLGRSPARQRRDGRDGVPHDPVPRGGRPSRPTRRHHRRGQDRGRGLAHGPEAIDRLGRHHREDRRRDGRGRGVLRADRRSLQRQECTTTSSP